MIFDKRFYFIVLPIDIALILLPFYDIANLNTWINFVSYFHNSQPAFYQSTWPGGFSTLSALIPLESSYLASGFNFYFASIVLKLVFFLFTLLTSMILYDIVMRSGNEKKAKLVFLFTMLNPAILYVNYVWAQLDIIPIFLVLLSYYLLRYEPLSTNAHLRTMIGLLPLFLAVFFYLYPIILVPSLIYYRVKTKQKLQIVGYAVLYGLLFLAIDVWAFRGGLFNYVAAGSGVVFGNAYFSGMQYYIQLPLYEYLALLIFLSLILPLAIKKLNFGEGGCLLIILLLFVYTSPLPLPDEFIWIYPFTILALHEINTSTISLRYINLLNLFPYVGLIFISLFIGTGFQQGILYFGYNVFHLNHIFVSTNFLQFSEWYNALLIGSLVTAIATIAILHQTKQMNPFVEEPMITPLNHSMKWKLIACYSIITVLLVFAAITYNNTNNPAKVGDNIKTPVGYFYPETPSSIYIMPVLDQTFWVTGNSVFFYASYYTTMLIRSLQNSELNLSGTFSIYPDPPSGIGLINMRNLSASVVNEPLLTSNQSVSVSPSTINSSPVNNLQGPIPSNQTIYYLNGNSSLTYHLEGTSLLSHHFLFFFRPLSLATLQTIPLYIKSGNDVYEVALYPNYAIIAYQNTTSGTWQQSYAIPYTFFSISWNYVMFSSPNSNLLTVNLNGYPFSMRANTGNSFNITIGVPPIRNSSNYALTAYATGMISSLFPQTVVNRYAIFLSNDHDSQLDFISSLSNLNYKISAKDGLSTISIDNYSLSTDTPNQYIGFGKLSPDYYSISWQIDNLSLRHLGTGNYLVPAFLAFVVPYFLAFSTLSYIYLRKRTKTHPKNSYSTS